ncbi:MAG: phosphoribosylamine--glycine ligase [Clostridia bacterium]|nr:phosphoribosylamine--glycine ligase [Clostridia bacterium]
MRVLVVGSGGREHAIIWKLAQSPKVDKIFCAPGNAGIMQLAECLPVKAEDIDGICAAAKENSIDFAVIGPEVPLAMGIVDRLEAVGVKTFGPDKNCAQLEASKSFTKAFLARHNIPTAAYSEYTDKQKLLDAVGIYGYPMVIKADGLAAGKGVILAADEKEAMDAIESMMGERVFGSAGDLVVVEECLRGIEASMLCFVDENTIVPMESAQDYKRIFDGDKGPNTGGMGSYSPSLVIDEALQKRINDEILQPTLAGFQADGLKFKGVLFVGLMLTEEGPKVIEFNNRFGDPETQSVLARLDTDIFEIFDAVCDNRLSEIDIKWSENRAVTVVLASGGYPGSYRKGIEIKGLENFLPAPSSLTDEHSTIVFHAGTDVKASCGKGSTKNAVVTAGGRVLGVTAIGKTHEEARERAFAGVQKISFDGMHYRNDIGKLNRPAE